MTYGSRFHSQDALREYNDGAFGVIKAPPLGQTGRMRTGLPALTVTDTAFFRNPNYHLPSDTIDTLDFTFMAQLVKSLELALLEFPTASRPLES
jgi:hypothetical protein